MKKANIVTSCNLFLLSLQTGAVRSNEASVEPAHGE
jgi:hypothetical protein